MKKKIFENKIIVCLSFLLMALILSMLYNIYLSYMYSIADNNIKNLLNDIIIDEDILLNNVYSENILKVRELNKINSDIVGWIEIENTNISYPVMIYTDNSYYLDKNYNKEYSVFGSLFINYKFDFLSDSSNMLIYGHNNKNGSMFADLLKYADEDFIENSKYIHYTSLEEEMIFEIFSVLKTRVFYQYETDVFRYYNFVNSNSEVEYLEFVNNAKSSSLYESNISITYPNKLITLSTCAYHTENGRFAIIGSLVDF